MHGLADIPAEPRMHELRPPGAREQAPGGYRTFHRMSPE